MTRPANAPQAEDLFKPSRLAAASFGLGVGALVGTGAALVTGSYLGADAASASLALGAGIAFWIGALMSPAALVTGVLAKMRGRRPGWWSTGGILLGAVVLVLVVITLALLNGILSTVA